MSRALKQATGTGDVVASPAWLHSVVLTHSVAGTVTIRDGTGANLLTLNCPAGGAAQWVSGDPRGVPFGTSINVQAITGTASFEYS